MTCSLQMSRERQKTQRFRLSIHENENVNPDVVHAMIANGVVEALHK